jgi:hypothetical protein
MDLLKRAASAVWGVVPGVLGVVRDEPAYAVCGKRVRDGHHRTRLVAIYWVP